VRKREEAKARCRSALGRWGQKDCEFEASLRTYEKKKRKSCNTANDTKSREREGRREGWKGERETERQRQPEH
jgi:hypothetical protein